MKVSSSFVSLFCQYFMVSMIMSSLYGISLGSVQVYYTVLTMLMIVYFMTSKNLISVLEVCCVFGHAAIHINMTYNDELFVSNIWLDLILHLVTSLLTLYRVVSYRDTTYGALLKPDSYIYRYTVMYLSAIIIGSFITLIPTFNSELIAKQSSWNYLFSTLSVCNFSVVNIFREKFFSKRLIVEYAFTLFLFITLVYDLVPVYIFQTSRYVETYFVACLMVSRQLIRKEALFGIKVD